MTDGGGTRSTGLPAAIARIEAHCTFLGKLLYPIDNAAHELHHKDYSKTSILLAALYVCYLMAGFLDKVAERVTFDQHLYSHLQRALAGGWNDRCGVYRSPIGELGTT